MTPAQVFKMLEKHVPQKYIVQCKDHNLFGLDEDVDEMMKKYMPLLLALVAEHPYLKLSVVTHGVKMFFDSLGGAWASLDVWFARQQAYNITQMISRARKLAHNTTFFQRTDPALKPLVSMLKEKVGGKKKKTSEPTALTKGALPQVQATGRRMLRRRSSTATSAGQDAAGEQVEFSSPRTLKAVFGVSEGASPSSVDVVDLLTPESVKKSTFVVPGSNKDDVVVEVAVPASGPSNDLAPSSAPSNACSKPFWNNTKQCMQIILPSGQTIDLPKQDVADDKKAEEAEKEKNKQENQKKKKGPKVVLKKPAGMPPRMDMDTIGEKKVLGIKFTNGSGRKKNPAAYCCAKLEGKPGQTFLVEFSQAKTPKFLEEAKDIFNKLKDHLAKCRDTNFAKLKQMASDLKARIA